MMEVYDLETIKGFFLFSTFDLERGQWFDFCINQYRNDLNPLLKYLSQRRDTKWIGYNNVGFDGQILQYIWEEHSKWYDLSSLQISELLWKFAQELIDLQKYGLFLPYREESLSFHQIDLPRIWHFFNENKRVSLKQLEFELRAETIENFEVDHRKVEFTLEEVESLIYYCHNDIKYTLEFYKYTIGDSSHPFYKGKNKIADRVIMKEETGLECMNWDDVKIGAEWNKLDYKKATGRKDNELHPVKVNNIYGKKFKQFFPSTVSFQTQEIKEFVQDIGDSFVTAEKQEFKIKIGENLICIAKGGLHSSEKGRFFVSDTENVYIQNDIGSQYPNAIRKYNIYPTHLGLPWNKMITYKIERRLGFKELFKKTKDPKYGSLQEMGKLSLNGGAYGRLKTKGDWQEDHVQYLKIVMGCQLEILMIVEALTLAGFRVVSVNTDGWDAYIPRKRLDEYYSTCKEYEKRIGNDILGNFEYTVFNEFYQTSVNDYLAIKEDGTLKLKGDFICDSELHQNSSNRIVPLTLKAYFHEKRNPEEYINSHSNIFDFCARSNAGSDFYHIKVEDNKEYPLPKLIRYYVSKEGVTIWKMVKETCETDAKNQKIAAEGRFKTVCNQLPKDTHEFHLKNVDREYYIRKVREIIYKVEAGKPPKKVIIDVNQTSLF